MSEHRGRRLEWRMRLGDPDHEPPPKEAQCMTLCGSGPRANDLECEPAFEPLSVISNLVLLVVIFHHYMPLCSRQ